MADTPTRNLFRDALGDGRFVVNLEHVPETADKPFAEAVAAVSAEARKVAHDDRIAAVNIGDRVKAIDSHSTVDVGRHLAEVSGKTPLLHLAGKDRTRDQAVAEFRRALDHGLDNFLLLTGDRVPGHDRPGTVPYLDSAIAIAEARDLSPDCLIGGAVSPFKYREEELINQYLKMVKKHLAGADFFIANSGWDMTKFQELVWYRDARGFDFPLIANLLIAAPGWMRAINKKRLPGVHVTDDLLAKIEEECAGPDGGFEARYRRLALQLVGIRLMGYVGIHVSGIEAYDNLIRILELAEALAAEIADLDAWWAAWLRAHVLADGRDVDFAPADPLYLFPDGAPGPGSLAMPPDPGRASADRAEMRSYARLSATDRHLFRDGSSGARIVAPILDGIAALPLGERALVGIERWIKEPSLGCVTCGFCRLESTFFVCPETCPKGLANGPCSGTDDNVCEFKDRECMHNRTYRLAKAAGRLTDLEEELIPPVVGPRDTSSWTNHYHKRNPPPARLPCRPKLD